MLLGSPEISMVGTVGFQIQVPDDRLIPLSGVGAAEDPLHAVMADSNDAGLVEAAATGAADRGAAFLSSAEFDIRRMAIALARHEQARAPDASSLVAGYTRPGRSLSRGTPLPFPEPVGSRWGRLVEAGDELKLCEAMVSGPWGAVTSLVTTSDGLTRAVGVSDLAVRLDAFALAAAVLTPDNIPSAYVDTLLGLGMEAAVTTVPEVERKRRRTR